MPDAMTPHILAVEAELHDSQGFRMGVGYDAQGLASLLPPRSTQEPLDVGLHHDSSAGAICKHGRRRRRCKSCGGCSICEHGRQRRSKCKSFLLRCAVQSVFLDSTHGRVGCPDPLLETWTLLTTPDACAGSRIPCIRVSCDGRHVCPVRSEDAFHLVT